MQGINRWARCPQCGHKLFKDFGQADIEIKCSSCKAIVTIQGGVTVGCIGDNKKGADLNRECRRDKYYVRKQRIENADPRG